MSKNGDYSITIKDFNKYGYTNGAFWFNVVKYDAEGNKTFPDYVDKISDITAKIGTTDIVNTKFKGAFADGSDKATRINICNTWGNNDPEEEDPEKLYYDEEMELLPLAADGKLVTDGEIGEVYSAPAGDFVMNFKVSGIVEENPENPTPENPGVSGTTADAATVTAVTMTEPANKNVVVTASSAAVTAAAVLKLDGKELGQIATQGVVVVTTAAGVKVDVSTKAAVATKGATTATFAALFTVPAHAATGSYPVYVKVATKGAAATTVGGVVGTLTINAATAAVVEEPPVVDVPGKATKSIKLAVKKATIGVKEKINVKVTTKKTAAATAAKKVTVSKNSKKAVATAKISGKKLVITGKKAGKTVITVKSGKKTAKITVTVKKAPKKVGLKDGNTAAKKTGSRSAKRTKTA